MSFLGKYTTFFTSRDHDAPFYKNLEGVINSDFYGLNSTTQTYFSRLETYYPYLESIWSPWFKNTFITHPHLFLGTSGSEGFYKTSILPYTSLYNNTTTTHSSDDFASRGTIYCPTTGWIKVRIAAADFISLNIYSYNEPSTSFATRTFIRNVSTSSTNYTTPLNNTENSYYGNSIEFEYYGFKNEYLWLSFTARNDGSSSSFQSNPWAVAYEFQAPYYEVPLKEETSLTVTPNSTINDYDVAISNRDVISVTLNISSSIKYVNEIIIYRIVADTNGTILQTDAINTISQWGYPSSSRTYGSPGRSSQQNGQDYGLVTPGSPNYSTTISTTVPEYVYDLENNAIIYFRVTFSSASESKTYDYNQNYITVYELPRIYNFDYKKKSNGDYEFSWYVVNGTVKSLIGTSLTNSNNQTIFFDNYSLNNNQTFTVSSQNIISPGKYKLIVSNQYGTKSTISGLDTTKNYNPIDIIVGEPQNSVDSLDINIPPSYNTSTPNEEKVIITSPGKTTITIPENCITATVKMWGAGGKDGNTPPGYLQQNWFAFGGAGGFAQADIIVCPGDTIDVYVGKSGEGTSENKTTGLFTSNRGGGWSGIVYGQQHLVVGGGGAGGDYFYDPLTNTYYGGGNGGDGSGAANSGTSGTIAYIPYSSISIYGSSAILTTTPTNSNYILSGLNGPSYFDIEVSSSGYNNYNSGSIDFSSYYIKDNSEENTSQYYINRLSQNLSSTNYYFATSSIPDLEYFGNYYIDNNAWKYPSWEKVVGASNNSYQTIGRLYRRVENGIEILDLNNGGCSVSETVKWKLSSNSVFSDFVIDSNLGGGGGGGYFGGNAALFGGGSGGSGNLYNYQQYYNYPNTTLGAIPNYTNLVVPQISGKDLWLTNGNYQEVSNYNLEASTGTYKLFSNLALYYLAAAPTYNKYPGSAWTKAQKERYDPFPIDGANEVWGEAIAKNNPDYIPGTGGRNENGAIVIIFNVIAPNQEKFVFTEDSQIEIPARRKFLVLTAGAAGGSGSPDPSTRNYISYQQPKFIGNYSSFPLDVNASPLGLGGLGGWGTAVWTKFQNSATTNKTLNIHVGKCGQDGKDSLNQSQNGIALGGESSISSGGKGGRVLNQANEIIGGVGGGGGGASAVWEDVASTYVGTITNYTSVNTGSYVRDYNPLTMDINPSIPEVIKFRSISAFGGSGTESTFKMELTSTETLRYGFGYSNPNFENIIKDTGYEYDDYKIELLINYESANDLIAVSLPKYNEVRIYNNTINATNLLFTIKPPNEYLESIEYFGRSISLSYSHATTSSYFSYSKTYFIAISALSNQNAPKIFIYQFGVVGRAETRRLYVGSTYSTPSIYFSPTYKLHSIVSPPQIQWDQNQNGFFGYSIKLSSSYVNVSSSIAYQRILYVGCPGYQNNKGIVYVYKINGEITSPILTDYYSEKYNIQNGYRPTTSTALKDLYPSRYSVSFETNLPFDPSATWSFCSSCTSCSLFTDQELTNNNDALTSYIGSIEGASENSYFGYSISSTMLVQNVTSPWGDGRYIFISAPGESVNSIANVGKVYVYDLNPSSNTAWIGTTITVKLTEADDEKNNGDSYSNWNQTTKTAPITIKWSPNTLTHFKTFENPNPSQKDYFGSKIIAYKNSPIYITAAGEDLSVSDNSGKTYRYLYTASTSTNLTINGAGNYFPIKLYNVTSLSLLNGGKNYNINDELYFDLSAYGFREIANTIINPSDLTAPSTTIIPNDYTRVKVSSIITNPVASPLCVAAGGGGGGGGTYDVPSLVDGYHYGSGITTLYPYIQKNTLSGNGIDSTINDAYFIGGSSRGLPENKSLYSISGHFYYQSGGQAQGAGGYHSSGGGGGGGGIIPGGAKITNRTINIRSTDTLDSKVTIFNNGSNQDVFKFSNYTVYTTKQYYQNKNDRVTTTRTSLVNYYNNIFNVTGELPNSSTNGWIFDKDIATINMPGTAGSPGFSSISPGIYSNQLQFGTFNDRSEEYVKLFLGGFPDVNKTSNYQYYKVPKNGFVYIELLPQFNIFHLDSNGNWAITSAIYVYYNGWKKVQDAYIYKNNKWNKLN